MAATRIQFPVSREAAPGILQAHGILPTAQRIELAVLLLSGANHWSADRILSKLAEKGAAVSKATVYNTLALFVARGLVREVIADPSKTFYDSNTIPHYHFYNVDDGTLTDFNPDQIPLERLPQAPDGARTVGVDVVIRTSHRS